MMTLDEATVWIDGWDAKFERMAEGWTMVRLGDFDAFDAHRLVTDAEAAQTWLDEREGPWPKITAACKRYVASYRNAGEVIERNVRRGTLAPGPLQDMIAKAEQMEQAGRQLLAAARVMVTVPRRDNDAHLRDAAVGE